MQRLRVAGLLLLVLALLLAGLPPLAPTVGAQEHSVRELTIGLSAQGRPITAVQVGSGERKLVVVGDTHGGPEANTYRLTLALIEHFRARPDDVPPGVRLYLIPTVNPDGLALNSRFDSYGVDLNRNMNTNLDACPDNDWQPTVFGAYGIVSNTGGAFADSQLESRVIRNFLLDASGAIFLHSNAGLVFPPHCEHPPSIAMAQVYAESAGYIYTRYWSNYMITGGMHDWAGSLGIAAITPELISGVDEEIPQNLAGVQAVLQQADQLLPLPQDQQVNDIVVPALIWRYWRAHGGADVFGVPLEPARFTPSGLEQTFTRARLELRPDLADTAFLVQPAPLGLDYAEVAVGTNYAIAAAPDSEQDTPPYLPPPVPSYAPTVFFEETGYSLTESFLHFWRQHGGVVVFGSPLSDEFETLTADGKRRIVQHFERAIFAYHPEDGSVRLEPLGWQELLREQVRQPWLLHQVR